MAFHIDINDPMYCDAAAQILLRHDNFQPEANITSAVRDFLILTGLTRREEIAEENPPSDVSRRAVDLTALDTFIEFKRRIGPASNGEPDPENVRQLDNYLAQSAEQGRVRMGVLTDGRRWLLRWPGAGEVRLTQPYAFTLDGPEGRVLLYQWLRDSALGSLESLSPDREGIAGHFGSGSPSYQRDIATLKTLYRDHTSLETIRVKRQLWHDLLRTALGEIAGGLEELEDLFIRHTYLGAVIGMMVQPPFLANRGWWQPAATNAGSPGCPVQLDRCPAGHRRNAVRDGHTSGGAASIGRILHAGVAGPCHGPRVGD